MDRVEHVHEVITGWSSVLRVLVREVLEELGVLLELRPQRLDGELVVERHLDGLHLRLLQQLLAAGEDVLQPILVNYRLVRQVVLY